MGSVSSEVFADTGSPGRDRSLGLLGCLGGFRLDRGLWLLGSFNIFTIVTTNLCNSNMFRDQHFGDVSWGDPNSQRLVGHETQYSREAWRLDSWGGTIFLGDQSRQTVRSVWFEKCLNLGVDLLYEVRGGRDGLQHQPLALLHRDLQQRQGQQEGVLQDFLYRGLNSRIWMDAVSHRWTALGERIKRSFLDMSVLPLDGDQEEEDRLETH